MYLTKRKTAWPVFHDPRSILRLAAVCIFLLAVPLSEAQANGHALEGKATWYGTTAHGKQTACGEIFNREHLTAAHRTLPFHTVVRVYNLKNEQHTLVRITDRGPFGKGRVVDLSMRSAGLLSMVDDGVVPVVLEVVSDRNGRPLAPGNGFYVHLATEEDAQKAHATTAFLRDQTGLDIRALTVESDQAPAFMLCAGPYETFQEAEREFLKAERKVPLLGVIEAPNTGGSAPVLTPPGRDNQS